jgi:hypothetical protein
VDLLVGGLGEIRIELTDGHEVRRDVRAHQLVGGVGDPVLPSGRRDRHGHDDPGGALRPGDLACCPGGGAGGDPVIHYDRDAPGQRLSRPARPVPDGAGGDLRLLPFPGGGHLVVADAGLPENLRVDHDGPVLADGAHREFRLGRRAELADHDHIERRAERQGHLKGHRHAAAGQAEHDHPMAPQVPEQAGEPLPGVGAVSKGA